MNKARIKELIKQGEGIDKEFKKAEFELPGNLLESVCSMLNRQGGEIVLGVTNEGDLSGVIPGSIQLMKDAFVSSINDPNQLNPKFYLSIIELIIGDKTILYINIPESSQVHSYLNRVYDRNEDGDFDITDNPDLIRNMHLRKQGIFSENKIYPALQISDFREDLIQRSRQLAENYRPGHRWMELNDEELLRSASLYKKDYATGQEGYTLAAALLLGKDEVIHNILPHYKTDAILRKVDINRYDDREIVQTNLIESYDQIMAFVSKHLPDKFHLERDNRISLRDRIFREVIANMLVHREFINEYPAKFIIQNDGVYCENWNRPHGSGLLELNKLEPFPKNPVIAAFFREIGRIEELGSGLINTNKYLPMYSPGSKPEFVEGDIFKIKIPVSFEEATVEVDIKSIEELIETTFEKTRKDVKEKLSLLLEFIIKNEGKRLPVYGKLTGIPISSMEKYIATLRKNGLILFSGKSPKKGGYFIPEEIKNRIVKS